ncbi:MAG: hypothetical protein KC464_21470, partial [Myxococcales bacterium]|nr:hypothetical protein [Myxococcales bacterium]
MSDEVVEGLRVRDLVVELGYVDRAGLEEALDLQEDLHEQGVKAHLIDVLEDLGLIDEDQRLQVLLHQEMRLVLADLPGARRDQRHDRWVMAAIVSASLIRSPLGVLAAAAALA